MAAEFNSDPKLKLITCCIPTDSGDEEEILRLYQSLKSVV